MTAGGCAVCRPRRGRGSWKTVNLSWQPPSSWHRRCTSFLSWALIGIAIQRLCGPCCAICAAAARSEGACSKAKCLTAVTMALPQVCERGEGERALEEVTVAAEVGSADYGRIPMPMSLQVGLAKVARRLKVNSCACDCTMPQAALAS